MKKIFALILALIMVLSFTACSGDNNTMVDGNDVFSSYTFKSAVTAVPTTTYNVLDCDNYIIEVKPSDLTGRLTMCKQEADNTSIKVRQLAYVDFSSNKLGFYNASSNNDALEVLEEKIIGFTLTVNHVYKIEQIREDASIAILRITDTYSLESDELQVNGYYAGVAWGYRDYFYTGVSSDIVSSECISTQDSDSKVLIIGDSFIEGNTMLGLGNIYARWCSKVKEKLNGSCFINGKGGASSEDAYIWLSTYLMDICQPEYCIIAMGMNDTSYDTWLVYINKCIQILESRNIIPVFVTVTIAGSDNYANSEHIKMNDWIRNSGYKYVDACLVTSLNYDMRTYNGEYFLSDGVHPNEEGHERIYKKILIDIPELFY